MQSTWRLCLFIAVIASASASTATEPAHLYDITSETSMPHLEENLRYAITRTRQCLARTDLATAFPVLSHPSMAGCKLLEQSLDAQAASHVLVCDNSTGTTGTATWSLSERILRGTLFVKLGGKNMTFFQRVTATLVGDCPTAH